MPPNDPTPFISVKHNDHEIGGVILSVNVEDHDRLIDRAQIVVDDPNQLASNLVVEGSTVTVELGWAPSEHTTVFEGKVTRMVVDTNGGQRRVTFTALDLSREVNRHERPPDDPPYTGKLSEIVHRVITRRAYGFDVSAANIRPDPDPEFDADHALTQRSGQRDWDFLQELAAEHDCRAFVEFNEGSSRFYFVSVASLLGQSMGMLHQCPGYSDLLDFRYQRVAAGAAPTFTAAAVDPTAGTDTTTSGTPPEPSTPPAVDPATSGRLREISEGTAFAYEAGTEAAARSGDPSSQVQQTFLPGLASDPALAERLVRRDRTRMLGLLGEGTARGSIHLRAKGKLSIDGVATWAEGDWYVTRVNHLFTRTSIPSERLQGSYRTRFVVTR